MEKAAINLAMIPSLFAKLVIDKENVLIVLINPILVIIVIKLAITVLIKNVIWMEYVMIILVIVRINKIMEVFAMIVVQI
jgi:hypothetical protein